PTISFDDSLSQPVGPQMLLDYNSHHLYCHLCPMQWRLHKNKCYWFSEMIQSWEKSKEDCIAKKSHLLIIDDQEEKVQNIQSRQGIFTLSHFYLCYRMFTLSPLLVRKPPEEGSCGLCSTQLHWICQKGSVLL
uniref:C-type lectin domain-containing protein n=1 Tax=Podarcis muralis TaxID=64176 RepID=A0A670IR29_PODMU